MVYADVIHWLVDNGVHEGVMGHFGSSAGAATGAAALANHGLDTVLDGIVYGAGPTFIDLETSFPESEFFDWARYWRALSYAAQNEGSQAQELLRSIFNEETPGIAVLAGQQPLPPGGRAKAARCTAGV